VELKQKNPRLRKELGVYYTPEQAVHFILNSLKWIIYEKFNLNNNKNWNNLVFLDPATGSGIFLYKLIKKLIDLKISPADFPHIIGTEVDEEALAHAKTKINSLIFDSIATSSSFVPLDLQLKDTLQLPDLEFEDQTLIILGNPPYSRDSVQNKSQWIQDLMQKYRLNLNEKNIQPLNDDYVKFFRYAESHLERVSEGIISFVTPHGFLDGIIFRQMRKSLCENFQQIYLINLHGNRNRKETTQLSCVDENIFPEIKQGISISFFIKTKSKNESNNSSKPCPVHYLDIFGTRNEKLHLLNSTHIGLISTWILCQPESPNYWFIPRDTTHESKYASWWGIDEIFEKIEVGIGTYRDKLAVAFTKEQLQNRLISFQNMNFDQKECKKYGIKTKSQLLQFQKILQKALSDHDWHIYNYRPFDQRIILYLREIVARGRWSRQIMSSMLQPNLALVITKLCNDARYSHVFICANLIDKGLLSDTTSTSAFLCPLYLYLGQEKRRNFTKKFETYLQQIHLDCTPELILGYIYGLLNAKSYRTKYYDFLRMGYPRIPVNLESIQFQKLADLGCQLIDLHLNRTSSLLTSNLSKFPVQGSNRIETIRYSPNQIFINKEQYFSPVPEEIWQFEIGGYTPIPMWLKYRKNQTLLSEDINYFCGLLAIVQQTLEIQKKIEKLIEGVGV